MSYLETPKEIVRALERDVERVCRELLPNGKRDGAEWCVGSVQGEPGQSFRVRLSGDKAGLCKEFDGDEKAFDLLHLWCESRGIGVRDAMREARAFLGIAQPPELKKPKTYAKPKRPSGSVMAASQPESPVVAYFKKRGITEDTLKAFHVLEQPNSFQNHPDNPADIVFPYLRKKPDGKLELINNKYLALKRTPNADGSESKLTRLEKDCQLALFGWHLIAPTERKVAICEGEGDCLTLHQLGFAALSSPNGCGGLTWLEDEYPNLERFDEIYVCFDMDEPGRKGAHALIERLGRHRCKLVSLPHKDANECLQKGVTLQEFIACFRAAESLRPDELLRFDELIDQVKAARLQQQANGGVPTGLMLPWAKANQFWFVPGKLTMVSGYSGHGKTTLYSHVIAHAIAQGERWCIASLEMSGVETVERLSRQLAGKSALNDYQLDNLGAWVGDRCLVYDHLGQAHLKDIIDVFTYSARRYGCTLFCVDSLMMLGVGHDDYDRQQAVVSELLAFARTHHVHVHLIHHPRKPANDDNPPNKYDIKGTGDLTNMAPNVLIAWRNRKKDDAIEQAKMTGIPPDPMLLMEPDATLKIDKNRLNGWEPTLQLWFDADSQQYLANQGDLPVVYAPCTLATGPINPP